MAVLGIPATIAGMLGGPLSLGTTACLIVLALSVSVIVNRRKWTTKLPVNAIMPGKKILRCPSELTLARQAVKLAGEEFGRNTISFSNYEPLRAKNPHILVCLVGADGEFLGYFDVLPLKETFAELFLQGRVTEKDLTHEDILSAHEMRRCKYVYIAGIAVCDSDRQAGQVNAAILIWGLLKYLDYFYGSSKALTFASAATGDGENLLQSFSIPLVCGSNTRADGQKMYGLNLSRHTIAERIACVPDYSLLCSIDWAPDKNTTPDRLPTPRRPTLPQKKRRALGDGRKLPA